MPAFKNPAFTGKSGFLALWESRDCLATLYPSSFPTASGQQGLRSTGLSFLPHVPAYCFETSKVLALPSFNIGLNSVSKGVYFLCGLESLGDHYWPSDMFGCRAGKVVPSMPPSGEEVISLIENVVLAAAHGK